ncbi:hypothetical protein M433DRAFT_2806 [Acidomyces richmondensis BFW]|nr:MAG: hypothetical protein FE78DRAFT_28896 [Acidomyces sp. 'richmondensis']KYG47508.1 hypothetical protein M433DRAFT_2806 [Acidomyces richmondensis BFW]
MSKKDFFKLFWLAWQKAFTEANIKSSWKKTGLVPWCPSVVLNKLRQQPVRNEVHLGRLSSSPPIDWDSPTAKRSIRKAVNRAVNKKTKKLLSKLTEELLSTKAQLTLAKIEKKKVFEALRTAQKSHKRGKKLIEEFRASEGSGAIVFSPTKVRKLLNLQKAREQAKEQQKVNKALKHQQAIAARELKAQEAQQKKDDKAAASIAKKKAAADAKVIRKATREVLKAQKPREKESEVVNRRPRGRPAKQMSLKKPPIPPRQPLAQIPPNQQSSRSGRTIKRPAHLLGD